MSTLEQVKLVIGMKMITKSVPTPIQNYEIVQQFSEPKAYEHFLVVDGLLLV